MKYTYLLTGNWDMTKVVFLVDKDFDCVEFPIKPLRKLYREKLLPILRKYKSRMWKVPKQFIMDNCFLEPLSLEGVKITERAAVIERIREEFNKYLCESPVVNTNTLSGTPLSEYYYLEEPSASYDSRWLSAMSVSNFNVALGNSAIGENALASVSGLVDARMNPSGPQLVASISTASSTF